MTEPSRRCVSRISPSGEPVVVAFASTSGLWAAATDSPGGGTSALEAPLHLTTTPVLTCVMVVVPVIVNVTDGEPDFVATAQPVRSPKAASNASAGIVFIG